MGAGGKTWTVWGSEFVFCCCYVGREGGLAAVGCSLVEEEPVGVEGPGEVIAADTLWVGAGARSMKEPRWSACGHHGGL